MEPCLRLERFPSQEGSQTQCSAYWATGALHPRGRISATPISKPPKSMANFSNEKFNLGKLPTWKKNALEQIHWSFSILIWNDHTAQGSTEELLPLVRRKKMHSLEANSLSQKEIPQMKDNNTNPAPKEGNTIFLQMTSQIHYQWDWKVFSARARRSFRNRSGGSRVDYALDFQSMIQVRSPYGRLLRLSERYLKPKSHLHMTYMLVERQTRAHLFTDGWMDGWMDRS